MIMIKSSFILSGMLALQASAQTFDWSSIQPCKNFSWVSCYSGMECARLSVPLNYSDASQGDAAIAVTRIKSNFTGSDYLGPLFFNPGGPGVSGIEEMAGLVGPFLASINPQFDIVSFDPRGVSYSTPRITFFESDAEKALWLSTKTFDSNSSSDTIARQVAQAQVLGQLAKDRDTGILAYVTTDNVARDMLQMVEAYGEEKLQYWGGSYGTVLGAVFATMFPDRVGKMIIDGVVDTDDWFSNNMKDQLIDVGTVLQGFYNACFTAGPSLCDFYASSSDEIAANLNSLFASVRAQPLPAGPSAPYGLVDYDYLVKAVVQSLQSPYDYFSPLASALAQLKEGNATGIYELFATVTNSELCASGNASLVQNEDEAMIAIQCADGDVVNDTVDELRALMMTINSTFPGAVLTYRASCAGWQVHPERFTGPIGANTSFPIMFLGNTADPITPLAAARKMSQAFPGSVVLQQNSLGHTSFAAPASDCTHAAVRSYFVNGTLPESGTVCDVESELFAGSGLHI